MTLVVDKALIEGREVDILIEVDQPTLEKSSPYTDLRESRGEQVLKTTGELFDSALKLVRNCSSRVVNGIEQLGHEYRPDAVEMQLAIRLDAQLGAILTKASAGAQMQVTLKWDLK